VDRLYHPGAQFGQIGQGSTAVPEFFRMEENEIPVIFSSVMAGQEDGNKKSVRIQFRTGFRIPQNVSFSADLR
jgi:hypothetical protein